MQLRNSHQLISLAKESLSLAEVSQENKEKKVILKVHRPEKPSGLDNEPA